MRVSLSKTATVGVAPSDDRAVVRTGQISAMSGFKFLFRRLSHWSRFQAARLGNRFSVQSWGVWYHVSTMTPILPRDSVPRLFDHLCAIPRLDRIGFYGLVRYRWYCRRDEINPHGAFAQRITDCGGTAGRISRTIIAYVSKNSRQEHLEIREKQKSRSCVSLRNTPTHNFSLQVHGSCDSERPSISEALWMSDILIHAW